MWVYMEKACMSYYESFINLGDQLVKKLVSNSGLNGILKYRKRIHLIL